MEGIQPTLPIGGYNEGFGGSGIWLFAILALMWGGFGGNRFGNGNCATQDDLNFSRLENQVRANAELTERKTDAINNGICSLSYELQGKINNTDSLIFNQTQKILDKMSEDKQAAMAARINQLELQQALCGVIRYPNATTYTAGTNPFFSCACNGNI